MIDRILTSYGFWVWYNAAFLGFDLGAGIYDLFHMHDLLSFVLPNIMFACAVFALLCLRNNLRWRHQAQAQRRLQAETAAVMQRAYGEWL